MAATPKPLRKKIKSFMEGKRKSETSIKSKAITRGQDKKKTKKIVKKVVESKIANQKDRIKANEYWNKMK